MANPDDLLHDVVEAAKQGIDINGPQKESARRTQALGLRLAGASYEAIGERLGISASAAEQMVVRSLERAEHRAVSQLRAEENARLDRAQMAIWGEVIQGNLKAISVFLQISAHRAKINGLYAPSQVEMSVSIRRDMEDALKQLETLVLHEAPAVHEERRDVDDFADHAQALPRGAEGDHFPA